MFVTVGVAVPLIEAKLGASLSAISAHPSPWWRCGRVWWQGSHLGCICHCLPAALMEKYRQRDRSGWTQKLNFSRWPCA